MLNPGRGDGLDKEGIGFDGEKNATASESSWRVSIMMGM